MRVYVSSDIEGVAGVVSGDHTVPAGGVEYQRARKLMTAEVNAAVRAAFDAGAGEVWVNDAHGPNTNLLVEELDERVELLTGRPKAFNMVHGVDEGFDAALFLGYHARTGTAEAVLDHAYLGSVGFDLHLNGAPCGEFALNAMFAGAHGVPVVVVSGDDKVAAEARALLPRIEVATVKQALSRTAARTLTPAAARSAIAGAVRRALSTDRPLDVLAPPDPPYVLDVTFLKATMADVAAVMPGTLRVDGRTVRWTGDDYVDAFRACRTLLLLGSTVA